MYRSDQTCRLEFRVTATSRGRLKYSAESALAAKPEAIILPAVFKGDANSNVASR